jgi:hypothetical protein
MKLGASLKWGILIMMDRLKFNEDFSKRWLRKFLAVRHFTTVTKIYYKCQITVILKMAAQLQMAHIKRNSFLKN